MSDDTITIDTKDFDFSYDNLSISSSSLDSSMWNTTIPSITSAQISQMSSTSSPYMTVGTSGAYITTSNNTNWLPSWGSIGSTGSTGIYSTTGSGTLQVQGDAEFDGNVKIKGRDITKLFEKIEDRLAILSEPDPKKLEKFAALKKAYDNYKLLEKLIGDDYKDDDKSV